MKKFIFLLLASFLIFTSCRTYVPDDSFERYLIQKGYDDVMDDYVLTSHIDTVTNLLIPEHHDQGGEWLDVNDLTGIEDFKALTHLTTRDNGLTHVDLSKNLALTHLFMIAAIVIDQFRFI